MPCVIQDWRSGEVLTLAYMNARGARRARARPASCTSGAARAASCGTRARRPGNTQAVKALRYDCDADACSRSSSRPARPATPASAPASTTATLEPPRRTRRCPASSARSRRAPPSAAEGSYTAALLADPRADRRRRCRRRPRRSPAPRARSPTSAWPGRSPPRPPPGPSPRSRRVGEQRGRVGALGGVPGPLFLRALQAGQRLVRRGGPSSPLWKQVRSPVWQAGPAGSTSARIASASQSYRSALTAWVFPDVAPLCHSSSRERLKRCSSPVSRRALERLGVHVGERQHLAGAPVLDDARHEAALVVRRWRPWSPAGAV